MRVLLSLGAKRAAGTPHTEADAPSAVETPALKNNRSAPRRPASAFSSITGVRLSPYGIKTTLVNISESGLLTECDERLKTGNSVTVVFEGTFEPKTVQGRVARNLVAKMGQDGRLRYHLGIEFLKPIVLPDSPAPDAAPSPQEPAPVAQPKVVRNRW